MKRAFVAGALAWFSAVSQAQSIKGTVIEGATRAPVPGVLVTMVGENGVDTGSAVRTDSAGTFIVHAPRAGAWHVRTSRIGYAPATSPAVQLAVGAMAIIRVQLTTIAQTLLPVQVVERRQYNAAELMSTTGFDLRRERGQGAFLGPDRLDAMGLDGLREVLATQLEPRLTVYNDPIVGDVLRLREGARLCAPEIYLDGRLLSTAPEPGALLDTARPQTALDSMRAKATAEAEYARLAFNQVIALNTLAGLTAQSVHGIEVYRANEVPPTSLGAWFGMTKTSIRACGTVAVWTKAGAISVSSANRRNGLPPRPLQVIAGRLLDFETGQPVGAGRSVTLLEEGLDVIGRPAVTDENSEFVIRTGRLGSFRLRAGDSLYRTSITPPFVMLANELVIVRLYVSATQPVVAPLGVASRVQPHVIGLTSRAGFTYRRERGQGGYFMRDVDLARTGKQTLLEVLATAPGVEVAASGRDPVVIRAGLRTCRPAVYLDGVSAAPSAAASVALGRVLGIEVYTTENDVPMLFPETGGCGVIAIWTKA